MTTVAPQTPFTNRRFLRRRLNLSPRLLLRRTGEREVFALTLLCAIDMYTTLWWVITGQAVEANGLLAWTFHISPLTFVAVKCASCLPALLLAPRLAQRHPRFTVWFLRAVFLGYVAAYTGFVR